MKICTLFLSLFLICPLSGGDLAGQPRTEMLISDDRKKSVAYFPGLPGYVEAFFLQYYLESQRAGSHLHVPAAIILAIAALESGYGRAKSPIVQECHNLFSIKTWDSSKPSCCKKVREHESYEAWACFRQYERPEDSIWDFCRLMHQPRYRHLTDLPRWNYQAWAYGLQRAGYATDPLYAVKVIRIIECYGLYRFDPMPHPHPLWPDGTPPHLRKCKKD